MDFSIEHIHVLLRQLVDKGVLEKVSSESPQGQLVYRIKIKDNQDAKIHPLWYGLMEYVKENGGHMKLNIRFKDGIPIEADEIKKKVRFDINARGG